MVNYPNAIDTDAEIPRVDDNITEIGGEVINALREAVFALEEVIGLLPQGSATDLAERLDRSLDSNGNIRASALSTAGIITSPITDGDVDTNAGIEESKLDLDYSTVQLKTWIDALRVLVTALRASVAQDIANLTAHTAHPATYGRHRAADVDAYGGTYDGQNAQYVLDDLDARIDAHISDPSGAHAASAISVDASALAVIDADNAQSAIEQLEDLQLREVVKHQDRQHSNAIIRAQDAFYGGTFQHGIPIIPASATASGSVGSEFVNFAVAPDSQAFASIRRNDKILLTIAGTQYSFRVRGTAAPLRVYIYGTIPVSGAGTAAVYRNEEETEAPSVFVPAMRNADISDRASTIQMVHPDAPFILGNGFRGSALSASNRYLRVQYSGGDTGDLDIHAEMASFSAAPSSWTVENVAAVLNEQLFAPPSGAGTHHPLIAFTYLGELGIACDAPGSDEFVRIAAPSGGNGAAAVLGLTEGDDAYGVAPRSAYIDGYEIFGMAKLLDAYGIITAVDTITVPNASLIASGIKAGMIVRVSGVEAGSYVIDTVSATALTFDTVFEHVFAGGSINKGVRLIIYADAFSLPSAPTYRTLYEMFVRYSDAYGGTAVMEASARAECSDFGGFSASNLDLMAVSRDFTASSRRVFWDQSRSALRMGLPTGSSIAYPGPMVEIPADPRGTVVRLYDGYGTDYVELQVAQSLPAADGYMDVDILDPISEERYIQVGTVLHDRTRFKFLDDRRLFGSVGRKDVRDDFTRDYVSYPRTLLRGNGVVRGLASSGYGSSTLSVGGGEILVDGKIKNVRSQEFSIPLDGAAAYNLFADSDGVLRLQRNDYFSSGVLATPSTQEILTSQDKTLIATLSTSAGNVINGLNDMRRFVGRIDDRVDLLVEENLITHGSFASLNAAVAYMSALDDSVPSPRLMRVRGRIVLSEDVTLPGDCVLEGDSIGSNSIGSRVEMTGGSIILGGANIVLRDMTFFRASAWSDGMVGNTGGGYLDSCRVENCTFQFSSLAADNIALATDGMADSVIRGCSFINVDYGIFFSEAFRSVIRDNFFDGVRSSAVDLTGAEDVVIADNFIRSSSHAGSSSSGMIKLTDPVRTVVRKNLVKTTSAAAAAGNAILISNTSEYCRIEDNYLVNSGSATGFQKAIVFDGGASSPLSGVDHSTDTVSSNIILDFSGGSAAGISVTNSSATTVSGNFVSGRAPVVATRVSGLALIDNHLSSSDNASLVSITTMGAPVSGVQGHALMGNRLLALVDPYSSRMVSLDAQYMTSLVSGNYFVYRPQGSGTSTKSFLYVVAGACIITGNNFQGIVTGATEAALALASNAAGCQVLHNDLSGISTTGSRFGDAGTENIDRFNKGLSYHVVIPVSRSVTETGTAWEFFMVAVPYKVLLCNASGTDEQAGVEFSSADIPAGVKVTQVEINAQVQDTSDLIVTWGKASYADDGSSGDPVVGATSPSVAGSYQIFTLTPGSDTYMTDDEIHLLEFKTDSSLTGTVWIAGVRVEYEF